MARNPLIELALRNVRSPNKSTGSGKLLSRRFLLTALMRLSPAAGIALSGRLAIAAQRQRRADSHADLTIAAVVDRMLPTDELPGARALGIDRRITAMTDAELKRSLAEGVAWLDGRARRQGASTYLALDEAGQDKVLQAALTSDAEGAYAIAWTLRKLAFTLYYTDPAVMVAFAYSGPPQPGGFPDFEDAPT